jgi:hypothetical protein
MTERIRMITEATVIRGDWNTREVFVDGQKLPEHVSQRVYNHSPDGFNWGYAGSGPAQLALAIMLEVMPASAPDLYQQFKMDVISKLPQGDFTLKGKDVIEWLMGQPLAKTCGGKDDSKAGSFGCGLIGSSDHMR